MDRESPLPLLVVDDDEPTRKLLEAVLRRGGHVAEYAANGARAIELLREKNYAAIVLDMMMPDVGGLAVLDYLATAERRIPVVICSAAGPRLLTGFDPAIVKAVVRKPFDVDELLATVKSIIEAV
jgi:CheY-like chemotaxis protein